MSNISIVKIPTIQIPDKMYPTVDDVLMFTERAKSFIQFESMDGFTLMAPLIAVLVLEVEDMTWENPIRRSGIKGTANSPSNRNQRLYCIRLDRLFLNIRLAISRIPMIPLISTLHRKKRIIKSAMSVLSFSG